MRIIDLSASAPDHLEQTASLLHESFLDRAAAWPDVESAHAEVLKSLEPGKISRIAIDDRGRVLGWIGGQPQYDGHVWELHPLVVAASERKKGIGRALVRDLEEMAAALGALTLWLGSDDEIGETSLTDVDLYADLPIRLRNFLANGNHPYPFYHRLGFRLVGVVPDANGRGKPDILLAKRIERAAGGAAPAD
jgi:aminoglycoside 6'-N-acetyltransferase I